MFSKRSRYYKLNNVVTTDKEGFVWESKALRTLPEVGSRFQHTLESGDRLDHLAYKYYRQSLHWWRICDANPEYLSPRELLGQDLQRLVEFTIRWSGYNAPWHSLYHELVSLIGVNEVIKGTQSFIESETVFDEAGFLFDIASARQTELDDAVRTQILSPALDVALQAEGLILIGELRFIKPAETLWQICAPGQEAAYRFRYDATADVINVFEAVVEHTWIFSVQFNSGNVSEDQLIDQIESLGFQVTDSGRRERIGKPILIPPRFTG